MKNLNFNIKFLSLATIAGGLLASCGSYQNNSYYENDGIYNSDVQPAPKRVKVVSTQSVDPNNKYETYFSEGKSDFTVFTDVDNYTSENENQELYTEDDIIYIADNQNYAERYGNWGQNSTSVTVNVYDNGYPYYYGGWNNYWGWGWNRPYRYGNYWGYPYNNYYYAGYHSPYYGWGWNSPYYYGGYYGGYYGSYYGSYYRPNNIIRGNGNRMGVVRNNQYGGRNDVARNNGVRNTSATRNNTINRSNTGRVTTVRENGVSRQVILRNPDNITRSQNQQNTINRNDSSTRNQSIRNNTIRNNNNAPAVRNNSYQNNSIQRGNTTTPSRNQSFDRSSTPSRSYSPSSSPSRGGSFGGGGSMGRGSSGGGRR